MNAAEVLLAASLPLAILCGTFLAFAFLLMLDTNLREVTLRLSHLVLDNRKAVQLQRLRTRQLEAFSRADPETRKRLAGALGIPAP